MGITYLIGGTPRSGKSELRKILLEKDGIAGISLDVLREGFEYGIPEYGISSGLTDYEVSIKLGSFLKGLLIARRIYDDPYVFEGVYIEPALIREFVDSENIRIVFLGYPSITIAEKIGYIRSHPSANDKWTDRVGDDKLFRLVSGWLDESKRLMSECEKHRIRFIDTSTSFENALMSARDIVLAN